MSGTKTILGDNFESGGGNQTVVKNGATVIQAKEVHLGSRQPALPVIPRDLQPLDDCFRGRDKELAELLKHLHPGKVAAVCGPGGMGKSALAAQAVNKLENDRFPDGIVFHSFYGYPQTEQALQYIAEAFQMEVKAGLASTVRQILSGKKALLILDGTEEADDLKAVLDLRSTCGVLITSRKRDDAQGFRLDLTPLEDEPAAEVLREHSGLAGDDYAVQGICKILDGWPVGLRIAGRYLSTRGESAADYLRWLEKRPFRKLRTGEHQEDNAALLLERSVEQVSKNAVQALRLAGTLAFAPISLMPFTLALFKEGEETDELELRSNEALGELVRYGLLETSKKGWRISHALVHTYTRTELALGRESLERLAGYYIWFCKEQSEAGLQGYARLDGERAHYLRLIESCLNSELWREVNFLVWVIVTYLDRQGWWTELLAAFKMQLSTVRQAGDHKDQSVCLANLSYTCVRRGDLEQALQWAKQSLPIIRELGDRKQEGTILNNMGAIYVEQGKYELALELHKQSLSIRQEIIDRVGESASLNNIAGIYHHQGDDKQALQYYEQCLSTVRELGYKNGIGTILNNMAAIYNTQGNHTTAVDYFEQALTIAQELGDRAGEAITCGNIGATYYDMGDLAQAEEYMTKAGEIAEQIGHPELEKWREELARMRAKRRRA